MDFIIELWKSIDPALIAIAGGYALSVIMQLVKKYAKIQSDRVIVLTTFLLSGLGSAIEYINTLLTQRPDLAHYLPTVVVQNAATITTVALLSYHTKYIGVKDLTTFFKGVSNERKTKKLMNNANPPIEAAPIPEFEG